MTKQPDVSDVWQKLREMDDKLDRIRGHVNIIASLEKEQSREKLLLTFRKKIGPSAEMQKLWFFADTPRTIAQLGTLAGVKPQSINKSLSRLHERGLLNKNELINPIVYYRDELSEDIGLDKWVEAELKRKGALPGPNGGPKHSEETSANFTESG